MLKTELSGLRTGRASAHLLDPVMVDAYGAQMPLNQVATVSVPEPRMISVNVWDRSLVHPVEKAIVNSNLGLSPATEGQTIRLRIPELNEDRRKELVKVAHKYAETARVAVRHVRRDAMDVIKKLEKDHKISKDDHDRFSGDIQKATDAGIAEIDHMLSAKGKGDPHGLRSRCMPEAEIQPDATPAFDVPRHVAIIMDGNGRWAATRGLPRAEGHRRGVEALRRTVRAAGEIGIKIVTIFSFSAENWSRPASEIGELMGLLRRFVRNDLAELHQKQCSRARDRRASRASTLISDGCLSKPKISPRTTTALHWLWRSTMAPGRKSCVPRSASRKQWSVARRAAPDIDMDSFARFLDAPDIPDPDLIIRTSGEQRLSNFLALAIGLQRAGLCSDLLAGFRSSRA